MPNKMERFTQRARRVLSLAQEAAVALNSSLIDTEHLLLGLMGEEESIASRALIAAGIKRSQVEDLARAASGTKPARSPQPDLSPRSKKTLELAVDEARRLSHHTIGSEHLLLGLLRLPEGAALDILRQLNANPEQIRQQVAIIMQERPSSHPRLEVPRSFAHPAPSHYDYFLLRATSRTSGEISHLAVDLSAEVKDALEEALKEAGTAGFLLLDERHLLLGMLQNRASPLRRLLLDADADLDEFIRQLRNPDEG
ncbi:MAG: hypothetical protein OXG68_10025 [Chloroflexi bacterium]|nr:hypothetical protein [Chloroflexota bacterium]